MKTIFAVLLLVSVFAAGNSQSDNENSVCKCVPYHQCNFVDSTNIGGVGLIDIREGPIGKNFTRKPCEHYLSVCCFKEEMVSGNGVNPVEKGDNKEPPNGGQEGNQKPPAGGNEKNQEPPTSGQTQKPPTGGQGITQEPPTDGDGTTQKPSSGGQTEVPPTGNNGTTEKPSSDNNGTTQKPSSVDNGTTQKPSSVNNGTTQKPPTSGQGVTQKPSNGGNEATQQPPTGGQGGRPKLKPHVSKGCGHRNSNGIGFRITGAFKNEANFGEFPWMVAILGSKKVDGKIVNIYQCGGSLIHPRVILTGAHCVHGKSTSELTIRAGEWDTQTTDEALPYQDRKVSVVISHPKYNNKNLHNDFALLILETPVDLADNVEIVCLPKPNEIFDHNKCFATGWGKNEFGDNGKYQVILKAVELPAVPNDQCQISLRKTRLGRYFKLNRSFMCAGGVASVDTCTGDGGSPLVCPLPNDPNRYTQAGIVAWGIGCGKNGVPGVYADVTQARQWIDEQLASYNVDSSSYSPAASLI